jgi:phosphatidate cytidylyltransferase
MAFHVKTFYTRATTALVFVALLLGCVWYNGYSFIAFFTLVGLIGLNEYNKMAQKSDKQTISIANYFLHGFFLSAVFWGGIFDISDILPMLLALILLGPIVLLVKLFSEKSFSFKDYSFLTPFVYITLPCILLVLMSNSHHSIMYSDIFMPEKVLGMIFFIWINDTGAYLVGSFFGKHKLYEKVSPNKTWEGTIGGAVLAMGLSYVVYLIFPQEAYIHWFVISIIVSVFGTVGDLVESMLKRMAGVKDSGKLMPGHGGVLDRFDSLFFATPFVFCYLALMGLL